MAGLAGALAGGWLIGRWCLGLVLLAESAGFVLAGLLRDDGTGLPRRGEHTVADVLEEHRLAAVRRGSGWTRHARPRADRRAATERDAL